mmetsp:Transcript_2023/g.5692  ORF Transcript_2023/g.5692 Transcript_2023/m.5692 type:complete len:244 (-) Transcript_2023:603-1334(-)
MTPTSWWSYRQSSALAHSGCSSSSRLSMPRASRVTGVSLLTKTWCLERTSVSAVGPRVPSRSYSSNMNLARSSLRFSGGLGSLPMDNNPALASISAAVQVLQIGSRPFTVPFNCRLENSAGGSCWSHFPQRYTSGTKCCDRRSAATNGVETDKVLQTASLANSCDHVLETIGWSWFGRAPMQLWQRTLSGATRDFFSCLMLNCSRGKSRVQALHISALCLVSTSSEAAANSCGISCGIGLSLR